MFTNVQVIAETRALHAEIALLRAEVRALTSGTPTPAAAPATPSVASPVTPLESTTAKVARVTCAGHGRDGMPKACAREFRTLANLAEHNKWADARHNA